MKKKSTIFRLASIIALLLLITCSTQANDTCRNKFLHKVLSDISSFSSFINIRIVDKTGVHNVVVNNGMLYKLLEDKYGYNLQGYTDRLTVKIIKNEHLQIKGSITSFKYLIDIKPNNQADSLYGSGGIEKVKSFYFQGYHIVDYDKNFFNAVPYLFINNYIVRRGDIEGGVVLTKVNCNDRL